MGHRDSRADHRREWHGTDAEAAVRARHRDESERRAWTQRFQQSSQRHERDRERDRDINEDRDNYVRAPAGGQYYGAHPGRADAWGGAGEQWRDRTSQSRFGPGRMGYGSLYGSQGHVGYGARHAGRDYSAAADFGGGYGGAYGSAVSRRESSGQGRPSDTVRGGYRGLGPRGYRRADERVREEICERLTDAEDVDASDIEVGVTDGEVQLSGTVAAREEKRRAELIAETVSGVRDVHNGIRVLPQRESRSTQGPTSDA